MTLVLTRHMESAEGKWRLMMKIALTSVFVDDPDKAFKFYTEVLGFVRKLYLPEARLAIVVSPDEPRGTRLLLEPNDNPAGKAFQEATYQSDSPVIVLGVEDIHQEYERMKNLGVVFRKPPTKTEQGTDAIFEDTCGNLIQLFQA